MCTAIIQIGNSDDKLTQHEWARFQRRVNSEIQSRMYPVHFVGHAMGDSPWQNACWVIDIPTKDVDSLKEGLSRAARDFHQESIALTIGDTQFVHAKEEPNASEQPGAQSD